MIPWIGEALLPYFGPFRLLTSRVFLIGMGACLAALLTWLLLPRLWHLLPRDHGRADAVGAAESVGKPVGAGLIIMLIYAAVCLLVLPLEPRALELLGAPCSPLSRGTSTIAAERDGRSTGSGSSTSSFPCSARPHSASSSRCPCGCPC